MLLVKIPDPNLPRKLSEPSRPHRRIRLIYKKKAKLRAGCVHNVRVVCITYWRVGSYHQVRPKYNCDSL